MVEKNTDVKEKTWWFTSRNGISKKVFVVNVKGDRVTYKENHDRDDSTHVHLAKFLKFYKPLPIVPVRVNIKNADVFANFDRLEDITINFGDDPIDYNKIYIGVDRAQMPGLGRAHIDEMIEVLKEFLKDHPAKVILVPLVDFDTY